MATQNRNDKLGSFLLERGADPNLATRARGCPYTWRPTTATSRAVTIPSEGGYGPPVAITLLLDKGADVNLRVKDRTETRTVFTNQWLDENGATAFLRASQSGDVALMKLLLAHGADPKINTVLNVTPLQVAAASAGSKASPSSGRPRRFEAVKLLLELGLDANSRPTPDARRCTAPRTRAAGVDQMLADHGAKLDIRDYGNTDNRGGKLAVHTWQAVDYADGLVRVGVQSAIAHPEAGLLLRKLMTAQGMRRRRWAHARVDLHHRRLRIVVGATLGGPTKGRLKAAPTTRPYLASGSGRSWKCAASGFVPLPVSTSHGVRSPLAAHSPRPFQPAFGSSMRPSNPLA